MPKYMELYQILREYKLEIQHSQSYEVTQVELKCHKFFSQAKIHKFCEIYTHTRFSTMLGKGLRKNINQKKKKERKIGKYKLNEMGALNMKQKK